MTVVELHGGKVWDKFRAFSLATLLKQEARLCLFVLSVSFKSVASVWSIKCAQDSAVKFGNRNGNIKWSVAFAQACHLVKLCWDPTYWLFLRRPQTNRKGRDVFLDHFFLKSHVCYRFYQVNNYTSTLCSVILYSRNSNKKSHRAQLGSESTKPDKFSNLLLFLPPTTSIMLLFHLL